MTRIHTSDLCDARLDAAVSRVADRRLDPYAAVDELLRD